MLKKRLYDISADFNSCKSTHLPIFLLNLTFYISIVEIVFIFSLIFFGPPYIYAIFFTRFTIFPRRITPFMIYGILFALIAYLIRIYLIVDAFFDISDDISVNGPLGYLHIIRTIVLFTACLSFNGIFFECVLSVLDPLKYEKNTSTDSFYYITFVNVLVTLILLPLTYLNIVSTLFIGTIVFFSHIVDLIGTLIVYRKNKALLKEYYSITLGERFQVKQNIEICLSLIPFLVPTFMMTSFISGCLIVASQFDKNECWQGVMMAFFQCGITSYLSLAPLLQFIVWPRLRNAVLCRKGRLSVVVPQAAISSVYFQKLVNQWESEHKNKYSGT